MNGMVYNMGMAASKLRGVRMSDADWAMCGRAAKAVDRPRAWVIRRAVYRYVQYLERKGRLPARKTKD